MGCKPSTNRNTVQPLSENDKEDRVVVQSMRARDNTPDGRLSNSSRVTDNSPQRIIPSRGESPFGGGVSSELSDFQKMMKGGSAGKPVKKGSPTLGLPSHMKGEKWKQRRTSVSAESFKVESDNYEKKVVPKSDEAKAHIRSVTAKNFLFNSLDIEQRDEVIDAMFEVLVEREKNVITQGDSGDNFYVVDSGEFDIFVKGPDGNPIKVAHVERGGSFGELALMYNTPRAATVTAITDDCKLWAVDRSTFRHLLLATASRKRKTYESFLSEVPLLASLTNWERATIADALKPHVYSDGEAIITQGEEGDRFFFIENGAVVVTKHGDEEGSAEVEVMRYGKGGYFGELALIAEAPRAATVRAVGGTTCVYLDVDAFHRLLGPCDEILKRNLDNYESYEEIMSSTSRPKSSLNNNDEIEIEEDDDAEGGSGTE